MLSADNIEVLKLRSSYIPISVWTVPIKHRKRESTDILKRGAMGIVWGSYWCYMDPCWINSADTLHSEFWHLELQDNKFLTLGGNLLNQAYQSKTDVLCINQNSLEKLNKQDKKAQIVLNLRFFWLFFLWCQEINAGSVIFWNVMFLVFMFSLEKVM